MNTTDPSIKDDDLNVRPVFAVRDAILDVLTEKSGDVFRTTDVFKLVVNKLGYFVPRERVYSWLLGLHSDNKIFGFRDGEHSAWNWSKNKVRS